APTPALPRKRGREPKAAASPPASHLLLPISCSPSPAPHPLLSTSCFPSPAPRLLLPTSCFPPPAPPSPLLGSCSLPRLRGRAGVGATEGAIPKPRKAARRRPSTRTTGLRESAVEPLRDRRTQVAGGLDRGHARLLQRGELALGRARAARGDRAGMAHALALGGRGAGDEADHRLGHVLGDVLGCLLLGAAADLADQDDAFGLRVVLEQLER